MKSYDEEYPELDPKKVSERLIVILYTDPNGWDVVEDLYKASQELGLEDVEKPSSTRRKLFFSVLVEELYGLRDTLKELNITHVLPEILEEETAHRQIFLDELLSGGLPIDDGLKESNIRHAFRKIKNQEAVDKLILLCAEKKKMKIGVVDLDGDETTTILEVSMRFLERGLAENPPKFVILMGVIGSGKTTVRRQKYAEGYVNFDYGEICLAVEQAVGKKHPRMTEYLSVASDLILRESLANKKNIVIEILGDDTDALMPIMDKMKELGYEVEVQLVTADWGVSADFKESYQRHLKAVERDADYTSSYYTQEATLSAFRYQLGIA